MEDNQFTFERVSIVGCGLLGGSMGLALKRSGRVKQILGYDVSEKSTETALQMGAIDQVAGSIKEALHCDLLVLAAPVLTNLELMQQIGPNLPITTLVTDIGSTKVSICEAAKKYMENQGRNFLPAHPIAGSESHGIDNARADLFDNRLVIQTPLAENRAHNTLRLGKLWKACGALAQEMDAKTHDQIYAQVSHLPHLLAYALMRQLGGADNMTRQLVGKGFLDFTRIAAADPYVWADILHDNRAQLIRSIDQFVNHLTAIRTQLDRPKQLVDMLVPASKLRKSMDVSK